MMKKVSELFDVSNGHGLSLNKMELASPSGGYPFISRKMGDNGVKAYVRPVEGVIPNPAGDLTCVLNGNGILTTHIQERPYYTAYHVASLRPKVPLTTAQKLYYCVCIRANHYRYSWGRQANRTIKSILVPEVSDMPKWVGDVSLAPFSDCVLPASNDEAPPLRQRRWREFEYKQLFDIEVGAGPRLKDLDGSGSTPVITSSDSNNGRTGFTSAQPRHRGKTLSVNRDGSVAEAFYQALPFCSSEAVHVFIPKFKLTPAIAMFLTTLIRLEKFRYTYGRKWGLDRMKKTIIRLPATKDGTPDWAFMEAYIKTLPFSSQL